MLFFEKETNQNLRSTQRKKAKSYQQTFAKLISGRQRLRAFQSVLFGRGSRISGHHGLDDFDQLVQSKRLEQQGVILEPRLAGFDN